MTAEEILTLHHHQSREDVKMTCLQEIAASLVELLEHFRQVDSAVFGTRK